MRQYVIMFGACFRDISIRRFDAQGKIIQNIKVPIQFAPKEKWTILINENQLKPIGISLPRLSFYCGPPRPDIGSNRKTSPLNQIVKKSTKANEWFNTYNAVPYKLDFQLFAVAKNLDDMYQIVEQIIPYFNQDHTVGMKLLPTLEREWDIVVRLKGIDQDLAFEGTFSENRAVIFTFNFEVDAWFFGPIQKSGIIKRIQMNYKIVKGDGPVLPSDIGHTPTVEIQTVTPGLTADGEPTTDPLMSIPYYEINAEDDFGFCIDITNVLDPLESISDTQTIQVNDNPEDIIETEESTEDNIDIITGEDYVVILDE